MVRLSYHGRIYRFTTSKFSHAVNRKIKEVFFHSDLFVLFLVIAQANCGKLTANYAAKLNEASSSKKPVKRTMNKPSLDENFSKKVRSDEIVSHLFQNKEMCVITGHDDTISKSDLEMKILKHGGKIVQNPGITR